MSISIKEVAEKYKMTAPTIRYYEKEGLLDIPRDNNGVRKFDQDSMRRLSAIAQYRKGGLAIAEIKNIFKQGDNHEYVLSLFNDAKQNLENELVEIQNTLGYMNKKINWYEDEIKKNGGQDLSAY